MKQGFARAGAMLSSRKGLAAGQKKEDAVWVKRAEDRARHFLALLGHPKMALPKFVIVDRLNTRERWLGLCTLHGSDVAAYLTRGTPFTTTISLQRAVLPDEYTFERTLAHEICHHVEFMTYDRQELIGLREGWKRVSHGERFKELGARINEALNDSKFVTEKSDVYDKLAGTEKPFWLFIMPAAPWNYPRVREAPRLAWRWAVKLDERKRAWLREAILAGLGVLVESHDRYWTLGKAKIGSANFASPSAPERQAMLQDLVRLTDATQTLALIKPQLGELPPR